MLLSFFSLNNLVVFVVVFVDIAPKKGLFVRIHRYHFQLQTLDCGCVGCEAKSTRIIILTGSGSFQTFGRGSSYGSFGCVSSYGSFGCGSSYKWFLRRAKLVCEDLLDGGSQLKGGVEQDQGGQHLEKQSMFSIIIQNIKSISTTWVITSPNMELRNTRASMLQWSVRA